MAVSTCARLTIGAVGAGGGDDDVGAGERLSHVAPRHRAAADRVRQLVGMGGSAARDHDLADAVRLQVLGGELADFSGTDDQHRRPSSRRRSSRDRHRLEADRHGALADGGFRAHPLADPKGRREHALQERTYTPSPGRRLERVLDLPENLRLADDRGFQPGGDAEQMRHCIPALTHEQVLEECLAGTR